MKRVLSSIAVMAVLAISAPVSAQMANPPGGTSMTPPAAYSGPSPRGETSAHRAAPSTHHPHHAGKSAAHHVKAPQSNAGNADQMNRNELSQHLPVNRMPAGGPATSGGTGR